MSKSIPTLLLRSLEHLPFTFAISLFACSTPTFALSFDWSFTTDAASQGPPAGAGQIIRGTIDGLVEGNNNGTGVTVVVTSTPTGALTGGGWSFFDSPSGTAFRVTAGNVTFADAAFSRSFEVVFFGGFPGGGTSPQLLDFLTTIPIGLTPQADAPPLPLVPWRCLWSLTAVWG
ncbi:MAG: hypothetical protein HC919_15345 [Oscillatoriales cyanobacterium SM2_2_1]|nr:hypothetical protein [Oscillatoriales cyanobacterium SM2_2_1]